MFNNFYPLFWRMLLSPQSGAESQILARPSAVCKAVCTNMVPRDPLPPWPVLFTNCKSLTGVYTLLSTVAVGAFVVCSKHSSAPWCFEHCGIGKWLQTSGRWSVVLKLWVWSYPGRDKFVCRWCPPSVFTRYWRGPTVQNSPAVHRIL